MTNINVIKNFIKGATKGKTTNLRIEGDKLMNYDTCLAERWEKVGGKEFGFVVNITNYSQSTSTIQNKIVDIIPEDLVAHYMRNMPMGTDSLVAED